MFTVNTKSVRIYLWGSNTVKGNATKFEVRQVMSKVKSQPCFKSSHLEQNNSNAIEIYNTGNNYKVHVGFCNTGGHGRDISNHNPAYTPRDQVLSYHNPATTSRDQVLSNQEHSDASPRLNDHSSHHDNAPPSAVFANALWHNAPSHCSNLKAQDKQVEKLICIPRNPCSISNE